MKLRAILFGTIIAAVAHTGVLGKIIYDRATTLQSGQEVVLETGFIDPRDLFRGHYTILNFAIERVERKDVEFVGYIAPYSTVYVEVESSDSFAKPVRIHETLPATSEKVILRAETLDVDENFLTLEFPFERFYADETRALELEQLKRDQKLGVILSVTENGNAMIKGLTIDGARIYDTPLF